MHASEPSLAASLRELLEEERRSLGEHPDVEEWEALHAGRLGKERAESLRDHLAVCQDCADLFLDLAAFTGAEPPEGTPRISDAQVEAALRQIQGRLRDEVPVEAPAGLAPSADRRVALFPPQRQEASEPPKPSWRAPLAMAAAVLVAVVGLTTWNQLGSGGSPRVNIDVGDRAEHLVPRTDSPKAHGMTRGAGLGQPRGKRLSAAKAHELALPRPPGAPSFARYALAIVKAEERAPLYRNEDVELKSGLDGDLGDGFTLELPRKYLAPGSYTIQVYGLDPGREADLIASYDLDVTP